MALEWLINRFPEIAHKIKPAVGEISRIVATSVRDMAAANAPKRSGFMASNIYIVTSTTSTYGQGVGPPTDDVYLLPQIAAPSDITDAYVACGANYSIYVELGTRYMAAEPFFIPAVEAGRAAMEAAGAELEKYLR